MATILLILQMLPSIIQLVVAIEGIFKGSGITGAAKKQVLVDALAGQDSKPVAVASALADKVVESFNKTGFFTHGLDIAPTPAPGPQGIMQNLGSPLATTPSMPLTTKPPQ